MAVGWFHEAPQLRALAARVIAARAETVGHIDLDQVIFAVEAMTKRKALARTYALSEHPIQLYTQARWAIVFYDRLTCGLTPAQRALVMWHELLHIPRRGDKLVDHTVKDFAEVVQSAGGAWAAEGATVPDILEGW